MSPEKEYIVKLAAKWEQRTISFQEELELNAWYQQNQEKEVRLPADFVLSEAVQEKRIWDGIQKRIGSGPKVISLVRRSWIGYVAAASVVLALSAGLFFYKNLQIKITSALAYQNEVLPGKQGATLTLANGKKIKLTSALNGELANESGVSIWKRKDGQIIYQINPQDPRGGNKTSMRNTLSTAKGETYQLRLPDGSLVYLNAASSLSYTASLIEQGKRMVSLSGEAYFEIAKDKAHPFVVESKGQKVEVLGTHFNVNSYDDEQQVATTLLEGSVKVTDAKNKQILKPGEQALNNGEMIKITRANIENITDWKNGDFFLDGVDFKIAMRKIARWYDVEVVYDASVPGNIKSGGWISRSNKLSTVLRSIESSGMVHFKLEGKKIVVSK